MLKWQFLLPMLMSTLFMVALLRAELRWREYRADRRGAYYVSSPYYLPYPVHQQIDLHWIAMLPVGVLNLYPASLSFEPDETSPQWPRILITILSCFAIWYLVGFWFQLLRDGKTVAERSRLARGSVIALVTLFVVFAFLFVDGGIRGQDHGPTRTVAGFLMPVMLAIVGLFDLRLLPDALGRRTLRVGVALLLTLLYAGAEGSFREELKSHRDWEAAQARKLGQVPGTISFPLLSFEMPPDTKEALALNAPALLVTALPGLRMDSPGADPVWRVVRSAIVWVYWYAVLSLLVPNSNLSSAFGKVRPWLRGILVVSCVMAFLGWFAGISYHGPTPHFGFMIGTLIPIYALRPRDLHHHTAAAMSPVIDSAAPR